jgi:hypothetical protein
MLPSTSSLSRVRAIQSYYCLGGYYGCAVAGVYSYELSVQIDLHSHQLQLGGHRLGGGRCRAGRVVAHCARLPSTCEGNGSFGLLVASMHFKATKALYYIAILQYTGKAATNLRKNFPFFPTSVRHLIMYTYVYVHVYVLEYVRTRVRTYVRTYVRTSSSTRVPS